MCHNIRHSDEKVCVLHSWLAKKAKPSPHRRDGCGATPQQALAWPTATPGGTRQLKKKALLYLTVQIPVPKCRSVSLLSGGKQWAEWRINASNLAAKRDHEQVCTFVPGIPRQPCSKWRLDKMLYTARSTSVAAEVCKQLNAINPSVFKY